MFLADFAVCECVKMSQCFLHTNRPSPGAHPVHRPGAVTGGRQGAARRGPRRARRYLARGARQTESRTEGPRAGAARLRASETLTRKALSL